MSGREDGAGWRGLQYSLLQLLLSFIPSWARRAIRPAIPADDSPLPDPPTSAGPPPLPDPTLPGSTLTPEAPLPAPMLSESPLPDPPTRAVRPLHCSLLPDAPLLEPQPGGGLPLNRLPRSCVVRPPLGRAGALFVGLPDVLHGLIASWLGSRDQLSLCTCSCFFNQTYAGRVTRLGLTLPGYKVRSRNSATAGADAGTEERGSESSRDAQLSRSMQVVIRLVARLPGLRELVLREEQAVRAVAAGLRVASGRVDGANGRGAVLQRLERLEFVCQADATADLLLALSMADGGGTACVCPGLRHLLLLHHDVMARPGFDIDRPTVSAGVLEVLLYSLTTREQKGAASLLTLGFKLDIDRYEDMANPDLLTRLLLTSKACESLETFIIDSLLRDECVQAVGSYLSSSRASGLRFLQCSWRILGDSSTIITSALSRGTLPLLRHVNLSGTDLPLAGRDQLALWLAIPSTARLVSLCLHFPASALPVMLSAALESHGLPSLRNLRLHGLGDNDAALLALVDGMESRGALPCLERLEVHGTGDEGIRRLAAFLTQGTGCSRTLRRLELRDSSATDEAGAQLGCVIQAGGLTALQTLNLNGNKAWGDATMCALVEALESGQGKSLKQVYMNFTGLGSVGYQRIIQAVKGGLDKRPSVSFYGCDVPELRGARPSSLSIYARDTPYYPCRRGGMAT